MDNPAPQPQAGIAPQAANLLAQAAAADNAAHRGGLYLQALGLLQQADHLQPAIEAAHGAVAAFTACADRQGLANALSALGVLQRRSGDVQASRDTLQQAQTAARESGSEAAVARVAANLAVSLRMLGQLDQAMACTQEATRIYRALGDLAGVARCVQQRAHLDEREGAFEEACQGYEEAAQLHEITHNQPARARAIANAGIQHWLMGNLPLAEQTILRAQAMFQDLGLARDLILSQGNLAGVCADRGDTAGAQAWLAAMLAGAESAGDQRQVAFALIGLAGSHASMGNGAEASRCLAELQSRVAAPVLDTFQFWLLGLRASLAGLAGDFAQAVELSASALEAARRSADVPDTASAERALGHWQHMAGNLDAAMEHTLNALELLERARTTRGVRFLHAIAQMSVLENQLRGAAHARPLAQQAVALANELQVGPDYPEPQVRQALRQAIELAG